MKRLVMITGLLILLATAAFSCAAPQSAVSTGGSAPKDMPAPAPAGQDVVYKEGDLSSADEERMIVRIGDMSLVVADVIGARDEIAVLAVISG